MTRIARAVKSNRPVATVDAERTDGTPMNARLHNHALPETEVGYKHGVNSGCLNVVVI